MKKWLIRTGRAVLMGLMWGVAWAPIGPIVGFIVDRDGSMDEPWIAVGALPGFLSGVAFSIVLMIAARGRRFDELSLGRVSAWGAVAGFLVPTLSYVASLPEPDWDRRFPMLLGIALAVALVGAASAAGSLLLARRAEFNLLDASEDVAEETSPTRR